MEAVHDTTAIALPDEFVCLSVLTLSKTLMNLFSVSLNASIFILLTDAPLGHF